MNADGEEAIDGLTQVLSVADVGTEDGEMSPADEQFLLDVIGVVSDQQGNMPATPENTAKTLEVLDTVSGSGEMSPEMGGAVMSALEDSIDGVGPEQAGAVFSVLGNVYSDDTNDEDAAAMGMSVRVGIDETNMGSWQRSS